MFATMTTERVRLVLMVGKHIRAALRMAAGDSEKDMSVIAAEILEAGLAPFIERVHKRQGESEGDEPRRHGKRP